MEEWAVPDLLPHRDGQISRGIRVYGDMVRAQLEDEMGVSLLLPVPVILLLRLRPLSERDRRPHLSDSSDAYNHDPAGRVSAAGTGAAPDIAVACTERAHPVLAGVMADTVDAVLASDTPGPGLALDDRHGPLDSGIRLPGNPGYKEEEAEDQEKPPGPDGPWPPGALPGFMSRSLRPDPTFSG
jgi:hypothetical protein